MSYATRACSQLTATTNFGWLASHHINALNRYPCRSLALAQGSPFCRLPGLYLGSRYLTSSPHRTRDIIEDESAREINKRDQHVHERQVEASIQEATKQQIKRPWQREGADRPPADESHRDLNKTMTKGSPTPTCL
ncbi:hypothetical protein O1611_g1545 [Lasiodiplodia mahajangana]|uniref:Uncharacterized protein n=1 Tax=Lasiodiplodia mahajangana TaxID=1108764 RepID=A0ACC2JXB2_9PEZI|nr:hypothetical protein O1611_g1545 [Lasiodiplodia mahajangana]